MFKYFFKSKFYSTLYRQAWLFGMFNNPLWTPRKLNTQEHGFHILKKQTIASVLTSGFVGFLPFFFYLFPLYELTFQFYKFHVIYLICTFYSIFLWLHCIVRESEAGFHTFQVQRGLLVGFFMFILSEVMFFFSIFWAFFYFSLDPTIWIGCKWPPYDLKIWNVFTLPTLNTIILLLSGVTVTLAHQAILLGDRMDSLTALLMTVILGVEFTLCQIFEYTHIQLQINESSFGSIFFFSTGFHGLHVLIGTIFLSVCLFEHFNYRILVDQHVGLECAIWYWHFVDVVWLFLFVFIYFLGT